jgi:CheY-like chemotaxis protein
MAQVNTHSADPARYVTPRPDGVPRRGAILVVEDRDDVRQGMAQLLELHGFLVVDAAGGEQALVHLGADPRGFALILLDLTMPGVLSGGEVRARQLAAPELAEIPLIVVSASEPQAQAREELRPEAWIEKPFRFDDLLAVVKQYVTPEAGALIAD